MISKEEYIANVASGNFTMLAPRKRTQAEIDSFKNGVAVGKLKKISDGSFYKYNVFDHQTGQVVKVEKFTGDKFKANTIVNKFKNFVEIVYYKEDFDCTMGRKELMYNQQGEQILRQRPRAFIMQDGNLLPRGIVDWDKVAKSNTKSFHRSLDNFYGYILSNVWKYFVTFTFSPKKVKDRLDDDQASQS